QVDIGDEDQVNPSASAGAAKARMIVQIVTGAQNVRAGDMVPVAKHKSLLPGGKKIEKSKLRGVKSEGMLCSISELGLDLHDCPEQTEDGIMILRGEDCKPGDDIRPIIGADDSIVEFEITNNRPDCLSMIGLARESAATFGSALTLAEPTVRGGGGNIAEQLRVTVENPELCPRYTAKMVRSIKIEPSPKWLRQRLRAAGVRPINNIVDITNYVMLEYGQPMHAFDYACLDGGEIVVRAAREGEMISTIDGTPRALTRDNLVIADGNKPIGVAGVMGGENSEITENTRLAVFESANFDGVSIRKTAMSLGMRTDASGRFEKGLDIENTMPAVLRACQLVEELGAGEVLDGVLDVRAREYAPAVLGLEPEKINRLLGTDISEGFMTKVLETLDFGVKNHVVVVPSWRSDVEHYTDLAEEVARFYGYDKIKPTVFSGDAIAGGYTERQKLDSALGALVRALGYSEIYTYSFIGEADLDKIGMPREGVRERDFVRILNPLGEERAIMRTTPIPGMLAALENNRKARGTSVRLYELAKTYRPHEGETLPRERVVLTLGSYGAGDFYAMKGAAEAVLGFLRIPDVTFTDACPIETLHPGRRAAIRSGGEQIGFLGQIHPAVAKKYGLSETYIFELELEDAIPLRAAEPKYAPLPRFPAAERDISVVCDRLITAERLTQCIKASGGAILKNAWLFDIYEGAPIPEGCKSAAFSLEFRSDERTLTDAEADEAMAAITAALERDCAAVIR
ncbi:MAG: phenylalanine--tRNA ligase subunit beta, partial [Oscillospiraceae bacterium]|nr:phenylalanine--tRNA ligase subunit beta [Oscillospiraceae bacterium]